MAEQEKKDGSSIKVRESNPSHHKHYRPTDLTTDMPDLVHKRSRAPAVPSVGEDLKDLASEDTRIAPDSGAENIEKLEEINAEQFKLQHLANTMSSNTRRESIAENVEIIENTALVAVESRKGTLTPPRPIPPTVESVPSISGIKDKVDITDKKAKDVEEDHITEEIAELQPITAKESQWSYDEEAGGLPRSESRASRVSRAVRQLFCCGVPYEAPSEENIPQPCSAMSGI